MNNLQKIQRIQARHVQALVCLLALTLANCKASMDASVVNANSVKGARIAGIQTLYVADPSLLPRCASLNDGQLAYVRSLDSFKTCSEGLWVEVAIKGPKGDTGAIGKDGRNAPELLAQTGLVTAGTPCANGGLKVSVGRDNGKDNSVAGDGILQPEEIESTHYLCNAKDGTSADLAPIGLAWVQSSPHNSSSITAYWTPSSLQGAVTQSVKVYNNANCSGSTVTELANLAATVSSANVTVPTEGTYWFKVVASSGSALLQSGCSVRSLTVDISSPVAASNLAFAEAPYTSGSSLTMSWTKSSSVDLVTQTLRLYRDAVCGAPVKVTENVSTEVSTAAETATLDGSYTFIVTSCDKANNCSQSTCSTAVVRDTVAPLPSQSPTWTSGAVVASSTSELTWTQSLSGDVASYEVNQYTDASCNVIVGGATVNVSAPTTSHTMAFAADGTYYTNIVSIDHAGNRSAASACSAGLRVDTLAPDPVSAADWRLWLTPIAKSFANWTPSTSPDVSSQVVSLFNDSNCASTALSTVSDLVNTIKTQEFTLPGEGSYFFRVDSRDGGGNLRVGPCVATATQLDLVRPSNPSDVTAGVATTFDGSLIVNYTPGSDQNLENHNFKACANSSCSDGCLGLGKGPSGSRVTGLIPGRDYYLCVQAVDKVGRASDWVASATTAASWAEPGFKDLTTKKDHTCSLAASGRAYCWGAGSAHQLGNGTSSNASRPTPIDTSTMTGDKSLTRIVAGDSHSCALTTTGNVSCWGNNDYGQLGSAVSSPQAAPVAISTASISGEKSVRDLSAGANHNCFITYEGVAYCWGDNTYGQLGNGTTTNSSVPVAVSTTGISGSKVFRYIASGADHSCGVTGDGILYCWGKGTSGQLGNNTTTSSSSPLAVNLSNVINASTFRAVSLGKDHSCAIASNGKGYCWGANADGQTGVGSTATTLVPSSIAESNFSGETGLISISAGELHSCAVAGDGIGYCWGKGTSGQLGTGASASQSSPSQVNINSFSPDKDKTWRNLIAGSNHTCGLTTDGTVYCFGSNSAGQLGSLASGVNSTTASALDLSSVHEFSAFTQISVGGDSACGITGKGAIYCWGNGVSNILGRERTTGASAVADIINTSSIAGSRVFRSVSLSNNFACAIAGDGVPYCWGDDTYGRLGNGLLLHASRPGPVDRTTISGNKAFLQVELGSDHACGLTVDGKAFCWGRDVAGSLGDGGIDSDNQWPVAVDLSDITGDKNITAVSAFHYTSFAITGSGKGMGWGYDYYEGLGVGSASSAVRPTLLDYTSVTGDQTVLRFAESGYRYQSCFLTTAGAPYCWGINDTGEAGVGNNSRLSRPTAVSRTPISGEKAFRTITIGSVHGCGVTGDGTPYCWGSANNGRIGTGVGASSTYVPAPVATNGMPAAKSKAFTTVEAWNATSCGLTGDGEAYCWGYNGALTIGDPTITPVGADQFTPRAVVMSDVKQMNGMVAISPGNDHTCGLDESGKAFCWGLASPRLGQGSVTATVTAPTAVLTAGLPAGTTWTQIGSGRDFSCALSAANQVYCWGADDAGQIGNAGINQISSLPIAIDQSALLPGEWFTDISVNVVYTCGRTNLRQQYCWGYNGHGAIGDNTTVNRQTAVLTNLSPLVGPKSNAVLGVGSSSAYSSCVLSDFDSSLYCWGLNDKGQIGNGTLVNQSQLVAVDRSNIPNGTQFKMVSTGRWATCAVDTSDNLWCWGTADVPVVGETTSLVPRLQDLRNLPVESEIVDLSVGDGHACLLTQNGDPYCWGYNLDYRTGVSSDNPANVLKPTKVDMSRVEGIKKFRSVRVSVSTTCAISWMGQAYCWGNDTNERLGDGQSGGIARIPQRVNLTQK